MRGKKRILGSNNLDLTDLVQQPVMTKSYLLLLVCLLNLHTLPAVANLNSVAVSFYSEQITLPYNTDFLQPYAGPVQEKMLVNYYRQLLRQDYRTLLEALDRQRQALRLNDWLYYELIGQTIGQIAPQLSSLQRELLSWFLLSQSGFDTRLTFRQDAVYLYVYSTEQVFEVPLIKDGNRSFVNLTSVHNRKQNDTQGLYLLNFNPVPEGRSFSFLLKQLPLLRPQTTSRSFRFSYGDYVYQIDAELDLTLIAVMEHHPVIAEAQYVETPLSPTLFASLLSQFRPMIQGKSEQEIAEFLVAFTRSAFPYMDDKDYFGYSRPMFADEVLYYPYSDCEDRVALFYQLAQQLLDLPMIAVAFEDHLTVAVAFSTAVGQPIPYKGRNYYICDPTGPVNSTAIGRFPKGYEFRPFDIICEYK